MLFGHLTSWCLHWLPGNLTLMTRLQGNCKRRRLIWTVFEFCIGATSIEVIGAGMASPTMTHHICVVWPLTVKCFHKKKQQLRNKTNNLMLTDVFYRYQIVKRSWLCPAAACSLTQAHLGQDSYILIHDQTRQVWLIFPDMTAIITRPMYLWLKL